MCNQDSYNDWDEPFFCLTIAKPLRTIILCVNGRYKTAHKMTTALHKNKTRPWTKMYKLFRHPTIIWYACSARILFTCDLVWFVSFRFVRPFVRQISSLHSLALVLYNLFVCGCASGWVWLRAKRSSKRTNERNEKRAIMCEWVLRKQSMYLCDMHLGFRLLKSFCVMCNQFSFPYSSRAVPL